MHFFLACPLFAAQRLELINTVEIYSRCTVFNLLYGDPNISYNDNIRVFAAVHKYIVDSKRFD